MALISVILPTYNRAQLLPRAIASVLTQSHAELELIVADDASTDDTEAVVTGIGDPRLRYLRCPRNGGPGYARNRGLEVARGEFIAFQDSDDEWLPHKLERQLSQLREAPPEVAMVCSSYIARFPDGSAQLVPAPGQDDAGTLERDVLRGYCGIPPAWLVRLACLRELGGFDERLPNREDWDLVLRITAHWQLLAQPEALTVKHVTPGSIEHDWLRRVASGRVILQRHAVRFERLPAVAALHQYELAQACLQLEDIAGARQALVQTLRLRPGWLKPATLQLILLFGLRPLRFLQKLRARLRRLRIRQSNS